MATPLHCEEPGARQLRRETEAALAVIRALRRAERQSRRGWLLAAVLFAGFASFPFLARMGFSLPVIFDFSRFTAEPVTTVVQALFVMLCCLGTGVSLTKAAAPLDVRSRELEARLKRELREHS